ncbi:hypothetical protein PR048_028347 [Dryococelus australis]|uniref:Uncharacterized protein n=1 Tax=Dryococelus australis TaxID=614101 RepID=A0ABQ9GJ23_9NEOP|nr:hypothetical protein PR048_028347 [Dryococelus australis]
MRFSSPLIWTLHVWASGFATLKSRWTSHQMECFGGGEELRSIFNHGRCRAEERRCNRCKSRYGTRHGKLDTSNYQTCDETWQLQAKNAMADAVQIGIGSYGRPCTSFDRCRVKDKKEYETTNLVDSDKTYGIVERQERKRWNGRKRNNERKSVRFTDPLLDPCAPKGTIPIYSPIPVRPKELFPSTPRSLCAQRNYSHLLPDPCAPKGTIPIHSPIPVRPKELFPSTPRSLCAQRNYSHPLPDPCAPKGTILIYSPIPVRPKELFPSTPRSLCAQRNYSHLLPDPCAPKGTIPIHSPIPYTRPLTKPGSLKLRELARMNLSLKVLLAVLFVMIAGCSAIPVENLQGPREQEGNIFRLIYGGRRIETSGHRERVLSYHIQRTIEKIEATLGASSAGDATLISLRHHLVDWATSGITVTALASYICEDISIPDVPIPGFLLVGIRPDDAADRRVFSVISRFPRESSRLRRGVSSMCRVLVLQASHPGYVGECPLCAVCLCCRRVIPVT